MTLLDTPHQKARAPRRWLLPILGGVLTVLLALTTFAATRGAHQRPQCPGDTARAVAETAGPEWYVECSVEPRSVARGDFAILLQWQSSEGVAWEVNTAAAGEGGTYVQYLAGDGSHRDYASNVGVGDGRAHLLRIEGSPTGSGTTLSLLIDGVRVLTQLVPGDARPRP